jgi:peptidoglycan hydrolase-like protein with peptidoglycan-binding domain
VVGDSGDDVQALQAALAAAGYDPGGTDGDFGSQTATALEDWQEAQGLDVTGRLSLASFVSFPPGSIVLDLPIAQFLTEATVLSVLGGLLGMAAGLGLAYGLPHLTDQQTIVSYPAAALALAISALAALDPAEALRYE